jgi:hypothetical protein
VQPSVGENTSQTIIFKKLLDGITMKQSTKIEKDLSIFLVMTTK